VKLGLTVFREQRGNSSHLSMAAAPTTLVPGVVVIAVFQRRVVGASR
jgi:ABC-type glycerol-3-phosphate transport system permease component